MSSDKGHAYESLTALIRDGVFAGGQPLRESQLAARIGVSRTPIREALRQLAAEGVVELRPNRGATLVEINESTIDEIFDLRSLLEPRAAYLAATRASPDDIKVIAALAAQLDEITSAAVVDLARLSEINDAYHTSIVEAAASPLLRDALAVVRRGPLVKRTFHRYSPEDLQRSQQQHIDLLAAIKGKNPRWAEATMLAHIEAAHQIYR
jgi:DNA-binding GntR family transcriptional regulator